MATPVKGSLNPQWGCGPQIENHWILLDQWWSQEGIKAVPPLFTALRFLSLWTHYSGNRNRWKGHLPMCPLVYDNEKGENCFGKVRKGS